MNDDAPAAGGSAPYASTRLTFGSHQRIRSPRDFERIYVQRHRSGDQTLLLFAARNELPWTRIGLSISRKHGNSVQRHRLRRLLREAFRLEQHHIPPGLDLILIPGRDSKAATLADYRASLVALSRKLAGRLAPPATGGA